MSQFFAHHGNQTSFLAKLAAPSHDLFDPPSLEVTRNHLKKSPTKSTQKGAKKKIEGANGSGIS